MRSRIIHAAGVGVLLGYLVQFIIAVLVGYSPGLALLPSEGLRVRAMMTPDDPWALQVARSSRTPAEAEAKVMAAITYKFSADIYGHEEIPTIAETRAVGFRGDCKAQAVALGSVWQAMGVKFRVHHRYDHVWLTVCDS